MARVVVVGAGVAGLASAARLAALGHSVTVCEQAPVVGGKLGVHEAVVPGAGTFRFDTGPSLLTLPDLLRETFAATGRDLDDVLALRPLDPIARYRFADGSTVDATSGLDDFCDALDTCLSPGSGADWRAFMAYAARVWDITREPFLERPVSALGLLREARSLSGLVAVAPWRSLRDVGLRYLRDPRLRTFLDRYATYAGSDPRRAPAALSVIPYVEQRYGGWYVEGGLTRIGAALLERALELGVVVRTSTDVARVVVEGGRARAVVTTDGERLEADVVVSDADARHLYRDLVPPAHTGAARRRLAAATPSLSGYVLMLGVRGATAGLAHHNVLFPSDYGAEFDALFGGAPEPVPDPTLYVSAPADPAVAPPGHEAWFVLVNAPRQQQGRGAARVDWDAPGVSDAYAERLLDLLAARGLPVRDRVVTRAVVNPADLARRTRSVDGAIYGTSSNGARAAFLRPANRSPVPGLLLVGGSAHPGGGLPLVLLSARITAGLVGPA